MYVCVYTYIYIYIYTYIHIKAFTTYESEYDTDMTNLKGQISDIEGDISDKDTSATFYRHLDKSR